MKEKLMEMVKKGIHEKEIMKELGIQRRTSLRRMYYDGLVEVGKIKDIVSERKMKKVALKSRRLKIGTRWTMLLSNKLLGVS